MRGYFSTGYWAMLARVGRCGCAAVLRPFGLSLQAVSGLRPAATNAGDLLEILCIIACLTIWAGTFWLIGRV